RTLSSRRIEEAVHLASGGGLQRTLFSQKAVLLAATPRFPYSTGLSRGLVMSQQRLELGLPLALRQIHALACQSMAAS
ncbi:MAG: hypothetical protein ACREHD_05085, partial [Pirellulales bacterium]